jgi:hypothetical protein
LLQVLPQLTDPLFRRLDTLSLAEDSARASSRSPFDVSLINKHPSPSPSDSFPPSNNITNNPMKISVIAGHKRSSHSSKTAPNSRPKPQIPLVHGDWEAFVEEIVDEQGRHLLCLWDNCCHRAEKQAMKRHIEVKHMQIKYVNETRASIIGLT